MRGVVAVFALSDHDASLFVGQPRPPRPSWRRKRQAGRTCTRSEAEGRSERRTARGRLFCFAMECGLQAATENSRPRPLPVRTACRSIACLKRAASAASPPTEEAISNNMRPATRSPSLLSRSLSDERETRPKLKVRIDPIVKRQRETRPARSAATQSRKRVLTAPAPRPDFLLGFAEICRPLPNGSMSARDLAPSKLAPRRDADIMVADKLRGALAPTIAPTKAKLE